MLDLNERLDLAPLAQVLGDALRAAPDFDCMLVGAMARDLHLSYVHGIEARRRTADIDLAIAVEGWAAFEAIRTLLVASGRFARSTTVNRMLHASGVPLDLVPYGDIEGPDQEIAWPPDGSVVMRVTGYREARASAVEVRLPGDVRLPVVSLAGLLALKLFAFRDRALDAPRKDAEDIWLVLQHYLDAGNRERLFGEFAGLLARDDFDYSNAGPFIAGTDVRSLLGQGDVLDALSGFVQQEVDESGPMRLVGQVAPVESPAAFLRMLVAFLDGLRIG